MRLFAISILLVAAAVPGAQLAAQTDPPPGPPTAADAIANSLGLCRSSQWTAADPYPEYAGAFLSVDYGRNPNLPIEFDQYFGAHVAYALLTAIEVEVYAEETDLAQVQAWLEFCAEYQDPQGYFPVYTNADPTGMGGVVEVYEGRIDAWDSSGALFLLVLAKYAQLGGEVDNVLKGAASKALLAVERCVDPADGLTWNFPLNDGDPNTISVKFLLDNVEVFAGMKAATTMFQTLGMADEAARAQAIGRGVSESYSKFYQPDQGLYAWALVGDVDNEVPSVGLDAPNPGGIEQTFGIAYISAKPSAWAQLVEKYPAPPSNFDAAAGSERTYCAALRIGDAAAAQWRNGVIGEAAAFVEGDPAVYVVRAGVSAMALMKGADWLPNFETGGEIRDYRDYGAYAADYGSYGLALTYYVNYQPNGDPTSAYYATVYAYYGYFYGIAAGDAIQWGNGTLLADVKAGYLEARYNQLLLDYYAAAWELQVIYANPNAQNFAYDALQVLYGAVTYAYYDLLTP